VIVVDTNVVAYLVVAGDQTAIAREILDRDSQWAAPFVWRSELRNLLSTYMRRSSFGLKDALRMMRFAEKLLADREHVGDSQTILALAEQSRHSAYDCEFVAVAIQLGVPLITNDRKLRASFPEIAVSPQEFLAR
jgi:Predicted nucleic acid-binding protein, contains PIN domain